MCNEEGREFAGHLKMELLVVLDDYEHGRIAKQAALRRIEEIRRRGKSVRTGRPQYALLLESVGQATGA